MIVMVTFGDGEDEDEDEGDDNDDDDGAGGTGADACDAEVDIGDVLHIIKSRRTCRSWKEGEVPLLWALIILKLASETENILTIQ